MKRNSMLRRLLVVATAGLGVVVMTPAAALAADPLDPPTRLQAVHVTDVGADLTWVSTGLAAEDVVQRQVNGGWQEYARTFHGEGLELTGLTPSTTYTFRVYSIPHNGLGYTTSAPTAPVSFTTMSGPDITPPAPPPIPLVGSITTTRGSVFWGEAIDNVEVTGYHLQQLTESGWTTIRTTSPFTRNHSLTGLTPATAYTFAVLAFDARGNVSERSAPATLTTLPTTAEPDCRVQIITFSPGFQASVQVTNSTPDTVTDWTIGFTLPTTATITMNFGGKLTRDGAAGTIRPSWSGQIAPGYVLSTGFQGSAVPFTTPTNFTFNGLPCTLS